MTESSEAVCLFPLLYFQTPRSFGGEFDLGDGVRIRKITSSEIQRIQGSRGTKDWPLSPFDIEGISYALEKKIKMKTPARALIFDRAVEISLAKNWDRILQQFINCVLAMRLFKQGAVGYKAAWLLVEGEPYAGAPHITENLAVEPRHPSIWPILKAMTTSEEPLFARLTFNEHELKEYVFFRRQVSKFEGGEAKWPLAIRYFSRMYEDRSYEEELVDCMISFEALAFKGESGPREKRTPLALAISMLIGRNAKEREKIKGTLKKAYTVRNYIVHGKYLRESEPEIARLCWETEDYLRRSIRRLLLEE